MGSQSAIRTPQSATRKVYHAGFPKVLWPFIIIIIIIIIIIKTLFKEG
jgi:hypothetical protein